jgi:hypothetical protein
MHNLGFAKHQRVFCAFGHDCPPTSRPLYDDLPRLLRRQTVKDPAIPEAIPVAIPVHATKTRDRASATRVDSCL